MNSTRLDKRTAHCALLLNVQECWIFFFLCRYSTISQRRYLNLPWNCRGQSTRTFSMQVHSLKDIDDMTLDPGKNMQRPASIKTSLSTHWVRMEFHPVQNTPYPCGVTWGRDADSKASSISSTLIPFKKNTGWLEQCNIYAASLNPRYNYANQLFQCCSSTETG